MKPWRWIKRTAKRFAAKRAAKHATIEMWETVNDALVHREIAILKLNKMISESLVIREGHYIIPNHVLKEIIQRFNEIKRAEALIKLHYKKAKKYGLKLPWNYKELYNYKAELPDQYFRNWFEKWLIFGF